MGLYQVNESLRRVVDDLRDAMVEARQVIRVRFPDSASLKEFLKKMRKIGYKPPAVEQYSRDLVTIDVDRIGGKHLGQIKSWMMGLGAKALPDSVVAGQKKRAKTKLEAKDHFATPGKSIVVFWVGGKKGSRQTVEVVTVKKELERGEDGRVDNDSYRSILSQAMKAFAKKHPGNWKRVRHNSDPKGQGGGPLGSPLLYNMKRVAIGVTMKPPRGWKG